MNVAVALVAGWSLFGLACLGAGVVVERLERHYAIDGRESLAAQQPCDPTHAAQRGGVFRVVDREPTVRRLPDDGCASARLARRPDSQRRSP